MIKIDSPTDSSATFSTTESRLQGSEPTHPLFPPPSPPLSVGIVNRSTSSTTELQQIRTVLSQWQRMCYGMLSTAEKHCEGKQSVKDTGTMSGIISHHLKQEEFDPSESVLFCVERDTSKIQGVAVVYRTPNFLVLKDLVSNPENIRGPINTREAPKVHGIGTAIIAKIAMTCRTEGKVGVFLKALNEAQGFYTHCGFEFLDRSKTGLPSMFLPVQSEQISTPIVPQFPPKASFSSVTTEPSALLEKPLETQSPLPMNDENHFSQPTQLTVKSLIHPKAACAARIHQSILSKTLLFHPLRRSRHIPPRKTESPPKVRTKKQIDRISTLLRDWKKKCYLQLSSPDIEHEDKSTAKVLKKICGTTKDQLKEFDHARDLLLVCTHETSSEIQGILLVSRQIKVFVIKNLVINPNLIFSSDAATYSEKMSQIGSALISQLRKVCLLTSRRGVFAKIQPQEKQFYENHGFDCVDENEFGQFRMLAPASGLQ